MWKVAQIIRIPKPGKDKTLTSSYRPISLLPLLSKLFEIIFAERLHLIINDKNLLPNHQFGFRKKHSTIQQIHRLTNKIITDFDNKRICVSVFLDVSHRHTGLWFKLESIPRNYYFFKAICPKEHFLCNSKMIHRILTLFALVFLKAVCWV